MDKGNASRQTNAIGEANYCFLSGKRLIFCLYTFPTGPFGYLLPNLSHHLLCSIQQRGNSGIGPLREIAQQAGYGHPLFLCTTLSAAQVALIFQE